jgi:hypothetical protein
LIRRAVSAPPFGSRIENVKNWLTSASSTQLRG